MSHDLPFDPETVANAARISADMAHPVERIELSPIPPAKPSNGHDTVPAEGEILPPEFSDDALALRFSRHFALSLRFVAKWNKWLIWDGIAWRDDNTLHVYDLVRRVCRLASSEAKGGKVSAILASGRTVAAVEKLIRSDRRHAATVDQWDDDPWLLNTPAGVIDLRTRELAPHNPNLHMTKCTTVAPDWEAECPIWLNFLDRVTGGDASLAAYLQRACGYALTGLTRDHAMFFLYGTGRNGKGVFLNTCAAIMGDYAMTADPDTFTAAGAGKHLTVLARLQGARLVVAQETEEGVPWAESRIKQITGGDPITANYMRQDPFTYLPQFKLFMAGNHKPTLKVVDEAIKARFNLVPFSVTIPVAERDAELTEKLIAERAAILAWMIDGCWDWQHVRLAPPPIIANATVEYLASEDVMAMWIEDKCDVGRPYEAESGALFKSWGAWAAAAGEQIGSQKRFSQALAARGFSAKKERGQRLFVGLQLKIPRPRTETESDRE